MDDKRRTARGGVLLITLAWVAGAWPARADDWQTPPVALPQPLRHPAIAATSEELVRLQTAFRGSGPEQRVVAEVVTHAEKNLGQPLAFPPRGGQHNQWYQCEACQLALKTIDDTHHECPRCRKVYSGEPYDDVIFARQHVANLQRMAHAAWAYAITGDQKYAQAAAAVLLGYAERYTHYPYHTAARSVVAGTSGGHLFEQTLNEANHMAEQIAPAFDLIHDAPCLTPADRATIRDGLLVPMLENMDRHKAGKGNWQTWHNAGMLAGGAVLGEERWVRKAIGDPQNGFIYQMQASISAEGMWYENSWGYHFYTLGAMVRIVEGARRLGIDLWSHPALKKMFTVPVEYALPDGSLPRFGDDVHTSVHAASEYLEYAWPAYQDPHLRPYLNERPTWNSILLGRRPEPRPAAPQLDSRLFPGAGHVILRTAGPAKLAAAMTFGPYGGFHGHYDKLSFVFYAYGHELGVDPGRAASQAYRLPIHTRWYKASLGHNTVLVDRASQRAASGELECFAGDLDPATGCAVAVARCRDAYPGVLHRRLLCLLSDYLLVVDQLSSDQPHQFDWVYHSRGATGPSGAATQAADLSQAFAGAEFLNNVKMGATDAPMAVRFDGRPISTHVLVAAGGDSQVLVGDGVGASILDRVPLVMIGRHAPSVCFAAVLEPLPASQSPTVTAVKQDASPDRVCVTVQRGKHADRVTLTAAGRVTVESDGKEIMTKQGPPKE